MVSAMPAWSTHKTFTLGVEMDWEESALFWRERANKFEIALRKIESANTGHAITTSNERWEIAFEALKEAKQQVVRES